MLEAFVVLDSRQVRVSSDGVQRAHLRAGKVALEGTTREYEQRIEQSIKGVTRGRLWRAIASNVSPGPGRIAKEPVGRIFVKGKERSQGAIDYVTTSGRLRSKSPTGIMWLPLPAAGSRGRGRDLTPEQWEQRTGQKLRFIPPRNGRPGLLVLDQAVLAGKKLVAKANTARRRASGRGDATVPIFVMILPRSFSGPVSIPRILAQAPGTLRRRYEQEAGKIGRIVGR